MRHHSWTLFASALAAAALIGCEPADLPPGSLIDRDRVLGARVEVEGDPTRASPMPGERITVRWIVAAPAAPTAQRWGLAVCAGDASGCESEPFLFETGVDAAPTLAIRVPPADALAASDVLWIAGEIAGAEVVVTVPVAVDGIAGANHNPSLGAAAATIAGAPWPASAPGAPTPGAEGCAAVAGNAALPAVSAASDEVELALTIDPAQREAYRELRPDGTTRSRRELLQVSHFTTVGALDRQFSVIESDAGDEPTTIRVGWSPSDDDEVVVPAGGLLVRFTFVVRDGRGGLDTASRQACLVP